MLQCSRNSSSLSFSVHPVLEVCPLIQSLHREELGSILGSPTGLLELVRNLPSLFPSCKDTFANLFGFYQILKAVKCKTLTSGKICNKGPVTWAGPYFKSTVTFSLHFYFDVQTLSDAREPLGHLVCLCCISFCPSGNIPMSLCSECLLYLGASKGFPMLESGAGCQMRWECGGRKNSFM